MIYFKRFLLLGVALMTLFLTSCSQKGIEEYNKPALHWYKMMLDQIKVGNLESADDYFTSLQSEHINSPLISEAMLVLAKAHMDKEQYLLAEFYYDEFIKRYGDANNIDFVKNMKIRAKYFALNLPNRDQQLLLDTIQSAEEFTAEHPYSRFRPLVDTMLLNMYLAKLSMDKNIASLYERLDKSEAAKYYDNRYEYQWLKKIVMDTPELAWYRQIFNW
ncbi:MAG: outer membrane protein assembly factor BamD [Campylobacterales bacterium]